MVTMRTSTPISPLASIMLSLSMEIWTSLMLFRRRNSVFRTHTSEQNKENSGIEASSKCGISSSASLEKKKPSCSKRDSKLILQNKCN